MMLKDIQKEILKLKEEKDICILAHSYQAREIVEIADFSGDSYALSVKASEVSNKNVIMCGVRFMAETVKILSPQKKVFLAHPDAGCLMADGADKESISKVKEKYKDYTVVAYINTTADLKTICDVCVTSSSAVQIVKNIDNDNILFIPDCNLGNYVAKRLPDKNIKLIQGGCPVHAGVALSDVYKAREKYPNASLLVHPECVPDVVELADFVGSTSAIMDYAKNSDEKEFIIGTELSIAEHLSYELPDKKFYYLSAELICKDMRLTTLMDVYNLVKGKGGAEINLDEDIIRDARKCIDEMIRLNHK